MDATWDCIVVGGGAAGLSAALVLGRARRRTLVIDAGRQSNRASSGIGGLLGHDTKPPAQFYAEAQAELAAYPSVAVRSGVVAAGARDADGFALTLEGGGRETALTVLLATGMDYRRPDLPGLDPLWGGSVFHCPFCHGWEHAGLALGTLDRGESGVHRAMLLRAWSDDVTLLTDGPDGVDDEERTGLAAAGVTVDERPVMALQSDGDGLTAVAFSDGSLRLLGGLLIPVTLHQRSQLAAGLGVMFAPAGPLSAETIAVDRMGATGVPGLFSAGDASVSMPSVSQAIAAGTAAAAGVVQTLVL